MSLLVLTPAYYPNEGWIERLVSSAQRHGIKLIPYGIGKPYAPHGVVSHIHDLASAIREHGDAYDTIMMTDAYDSFFVAGEGEILKKFAIYHSPVVISAERDCWPLPYLSESWPADPENPFRFPNAGGVIGVREALLGSLDYLWRNYTDVDLGGHGCNPQARWLDALSKGKVSAQVDTACIIFQTMSACNLDNDFAISGSRLLNKVTKCQPCVIHFNGRCSNDEPMKEMYARIYS